MQIVKFGRSVRGASHKPNGICQDANWIETLDNGMTIAAVADGHGSSRCKYSDIGSEKATKAFAGVMKLILKESAKGNIEDFITKLRQYGTDKIVMMICQGWKDAVRKEYKKLREKDKSLPNLKYMDFELFGTTLLGLVMNEDFVYALQIGDGDIMYVDNDVVDHIIEPPKFLGTETYSLSNKEPWKNAITHFQRVSILEKSPCILMMFSDGFGNSFVDDEQFKISCKDYFETIKQYGSEAVENNLEVWLDETSTEGCGDDITMVAIGVIDDEQVKD